MRKLLLVFVCALASIGAWAHPIPGGGEVNVENGVATFHNVTAGMINEHWNGIKNHVATRIRFDNTCEINKADLEHFLQGNTYYVDLFDITNGANTPMKIDNYLTPDDDNDPNNIDKIIEAAVEDMVSNNWQAKGIILPLNTGSGTGQMERKTNNGGETFTEYAVYYRDTQMTAAIYAHDNQMRYNATYAVTNAQNHYNTAYSHLTEHSIVAGAETFVVSTNNYQSNSVRIDLSSTLPSTATPNVNTKIWIVNDEMVYSLPYGRETLAKIYVETSVPGKFANAVDNTGIKRTPCERLVVEGVINGSDVSAINDFNDSSVEGPKVFSLAGTTGATQSDLATIVNGKLEYIIAPNGMTKAEVNAETFSSERENEQEEVLTNLKAVISMSSDNKELTAYVKEAGSLYMARYYATGGSNNNNMITPTTVGLTSVTLSGYLNARDIASNTNGYIGDDGHWASSYTSISRALNEEYKTILSLDLEDAVFENVYDMVLNANKAGLTSLTSLILPNSPEMTRIPKSCLQGLTGLTELCVPYYYEYIEDGAFWLTSLGHITTTDGSGALVDNGPYTWTISANVKELGTNPNAPNQYNGELVNSVFPQQVRVDEIYCLAVKVPKCYANVFPQNSCYGWGGWDNTKTYCRDRYYANGHDYEAWAVLRFPSLESYNAVPADQREESYELMKKLYTDVNKVFTKLEQTGAVDANGDPIVWPTQTQGNRAYNQASLGLTWNDWAGGNNGDKVPGGTTVNQNLTVGQNYTYSENGISEGDHSGDYNFTDYMGWHQIVLSQATYVAPDEEVNEEKEIVRNYEVAGLYTFCIPYDLTIDQVIELMGVPVSDDSKKIVNMFDHQKVTAENGPIMPEIYQLASVTRYKGTSASDNNVVNFILTSDLYNNGATKYLDFDHSGETEIISEKLAADDTHPNRCLVGGRPYIIKAYKRVGEKISGQNLGLMVMKRYADKFDESASCVNNDLYEQLGSGNLLTLRFAIPYEQHKVQAMRSGGEAQPLSYNDGDGDKKYYYTMVGQYWEQPLPLYCIYMSGHAWYRYTGTYQGNPVNYKWAPYKCIIMPSQEVNNAFNNHGGGYRDESRSQIPTITGTDLLDKEFKLGFLDGRNDDDFNAGNGAKYTFTFDDGFNEYDAEGNLITGIKQLDGVELTIGDGKVYNMSGQYMGKSIDSLPKGMYIVNGKKYVVK